jgi:hypothetical protein
MHYIVKIVSIAVRRLGGKTRRDEMGRVKLSILYTLYSRNYKYSGKRAK